MNYIDELFDKYAELWTNHGDCMKRVPFKQALTEALAKQRELILNKMATTGWILNLDQMETLGRVSVIILETKLEEL